MSELPIKLTTKAGGGYEAPWLTVDAATPDDLAFKAKALMEHPEALQAAVELANTLKAINSAAPILAPVADAPPTSQPAAPQQQGWGQTPAAAQQGAAQSQPRTTNRYGGQLHPEGKTCDICPNVLEKKQTSSGKNVWRCDAWRWGNGNPNGHTNIFID